MACKYEGWGLGGVRGWRNVVGPVVSDAVSETGGRSVCMDKDVMPDDHSVCDVKDIMPDDDFF